MNVTGMKEVKKRNKKIKGGALYLILKEKKNKIWRKVNKLVQELLNY